MAAGRLPPSDGLATEAAAAVIDSCRGHRKQQLRQHNRAAVTIDIDLIYLAAKALCSWSSVPLP